MDNNNWIKWKIPDNFLRCEYFDQNLFTAIIIIEERIKYFQMENDQFFPGFSWIDFNHPSL